jgi:hypothetical protein
MAESDLKINPRKSLAFTPFAGPQWTCNRDTESGPHPKAITYGRTVKVPCITPILVALFVFNFWDAIGAIGELEDLLWSG